VFEELLGSWIRENGNISVIASGMIGSRQGWIEAPYLDCPIGPDELAGHLTYIDINSNILNKSVTMAIVPGIKLLGEGVPDVMRGEETQVAGLIWSKQQYGLCVLPGTHSKWVFTKNGRIEAFTTFMSGELFALMVEYSILNRLMDGKRFKKDAFLIGCNQSLNSSYGILKQIFSARTMGLFEKLEPKGIYSYLSGIIIGYEIKEGLDIYFRNKICNEKKVVLVGELSLCNLYKMAFEIAGFKVNLEKNNLVTKGLFHVAKSASLI